MAKQINEVRVERGRDPSAWIVLGIVACVAIVAIVVIFLGFMLVALILGLTAFGIYNRQKRIGEEAAAVARWQASTPPAAYVNGEPIWHHQPSPAALRAIELGVARQVRERMSRPLTEEPAA